MASTHLVVGSIPTRDARAPMWSFFRIKHLQLEVIMPRPSFITDEDIARWSKELDDSPILSKDMIKSAVIREVCYAGLWLAEQLEKLGCPDELITRIQYSAGKVSFGKDAWDIHQQFLDGYNKNELNFADEPKNLN